MSLWSDGAFIAAFIAYAAFVPAVVVFTHRRLRVFNGVRPTGVFLFLMILMYFVNTWEFLGQECASDPGVAVRYLGVLSLTFAGLCGGYAISDRFIRPQRVMPAAWLTDRAYFPLGNAAVFWAIVVALSLLSIWHMAATNSFQALWQFAAAEAEPEFLMNLREEVNASRYGTYWAGLARFALLPPLALAALSYGLDGMSRMRAVVFSAPAMLVLLSRLATLHKAPAVFWLLIVVLMWASRLGRAQMRAVLVGGGILAAATMSVMYSFIYGGGLMAGWDLTAGRVTYVPQFTLLLYLRTFPELHEHLFGSSISFVRQMMPTEVWMTSYQAVATAWHIRGTPNAGFMADGWADFGWVGVGVISAMVGFTVRFLESHLMRMPRTPLFHGCYFAVILSVVNLTSVSYWTTLLTHGLGAGPILVMGIWALERRHRGRPVLGERTPRARRREVKWSEEGCATGHGASDRASCGAREAVGK